MLHARETARVIKMLQLTEKLMSDLKDLAKSTKDERIGLGVW